MFYVINHTEYTHSVILHAQSESESKQVFYLYFIFEPIIFRTRNIKAIGYFKIEEIQFNLLLFSSRSHDFLPKQTMRNRLDSCMSMTICENALKIHIDRVKWDAFPREKDLEDVIEHRIYSFQNQIYTNIWWSSKHVHQQKNRQSQLKMLSLFMLGLFFFIKL